MEPEARSRWRPRSMAVGHVARPANTWQVTDLIKSLIAPGTPINIPCQWNSHTPYSTCSFPLVKVLL
jgi:hypothetical protein